MIAKFLNERFVLQSGKDYEDIVKKICNSRGIPVTRLKPNSALAVNTVMDTPKIMKSTSYVGRFPDGSYNSSWFICYEEKNGIYTVIAASYNRVIDHTNNDKCVLYPCLMRISFHVSSKHVYARASRAMRSIEAEDEETAMKSTAAKKATAVLKNKLKQISGMTSKQIGELDPNIIHESMDLGESASISSVKNLKKDFLPLIDDLKGQGKRDIVNLALGKPADDWLSPYLPDGSFGKWFFRENLFVISCSLFSYNYVYPAVATYIVTDKNVVFDTYVKVSEDPIRKEDFMKKSELTKTAADKANRFLVVLSRTGKTMQDMRKQIVKFY